MTNTILRDAEQHRPTIFQHTSNGCIALTGPDVLDWLQRTITADTRERAAGVFRSLCLDRLGRIRAEVLCFLGKQAAVLGVIGGSRDQLIAHLKQHVIMEDVEIRHCDGTLYSIHGGIGDGAKSKLNGIAGVSVGELSWLTPDDTVVMVPDGSELAWHQVVVELNCQLGAARDWHNLRIAKGLPSFGADYDAQDTPSVAGLVEGLVSQTKGCYLGQEVVCKTIMRGTVREQVVRLRFDARPNEEAEVRSAETGISIGRLTSVADETERGKVWAIGRVRNSAIEVCERVIAADVIGQILPRDSSR